MVFVKYLIQNETLFGLNRWEGDYLYRFVSMFSKRIQKSPVDFIPNLQFLLVTSDPPYLYYISHNNKL